MFVGCKKKGVLSCGSEHCLALLSVPHELINTILLQQLVVTTTLRNLTVLEHYNLVYFRPKTENISQQ